MAATTTKPGAEAIDAAFEQVKDLNEQFLAATRRAGNVYVDTCEEAVNRTIEFELKVAGMSQQKWVKNLATAQADFARELTGSYTSAARSLLK